MGAVAEGKTVVPQTEKKGPPPPMLPELSTIGSKVDVEKDQGSLGADDMFKNIK
jgi:hypothetical protein